MAALFNWRIFIGWKKPGSAVPMPRYKQKWKKKLGFFDFSPLSPLCTFCLESFS
jgi:hypothetical protein